MASAKAKFDPLEAAKLGTDAPAPPPAPVAPVPQPAPAAAKPAGAPAGRPKYVVTAPARVSVRGAVVDFKVGRVIDSAGYDVEMLRAHGVKLERVE